MTGEGPPWIDERHVLHAGLLAGTLLSAGLRVQPVQDDDGNYTPVLVIEADEQVWSVIIMPEGSTEPIET